MIKPLLLLFAFLLMQTPQVFAQKAKKQDPILQKAGQIKALLNQYEMLSPFMDDDRALEKIGSLQNQITTELLALLNDKRVLNYEVEKLLGHNELSISGSADSKVYFFTIDEKTGGSYRTNISIIHYRPEPVVAKAELLGGDRSEALYTAGYSNPVLLDSQRQKYLAIGGVQTCNTCTARLAVVISLDSGAYTLEPVMQADSRYTDLIDFTYHEKEKSITYEYFTRSSDSLYGSGAGTTGRIYRYKGRMTYNGEIFEDTEKCEFMEQEK